MFQEKAGNPACFHNEYQMPRLCQREIHVFLTIRILLRIVLLIILVLLPSIQLSCTSLGLKPFPGKDLPTYRSQKNIVKQGYTVVPSPYGPLPSIYFGYDRSRDLRTSGSAKNAQDIDIIEYKILKNDGTWNRQPYLVFSDDDFDGIADRLFLDSNLDGTLDKIYDIALEDLIMNKITFKKFKPWQRKPPVELRHKSPDLI
jgi:hypothetical protein